MKNNKLLPLIGLLISGSAYAEFYAVDFEGVLDTTNLKVDQKIISGTKQLYEDCKDLGFQSTVSGTVWINSEELPTARTQTETTVRYYEDGVKNWEHIQLIFQKYRKTGSGQCENYETGEVKVLLSALTPDLHHVFIGDSIKRVKTQASWLSITDNMYYNGRYYDQFYARVYRNLITNVAGVSGSVTQYFSANLSLSEIDSSNIPNMINNLNIENLDAINFNLGDGATGKLHVSYTENGSHVLRATVNIVNAQIRPSSILEITNQECARDWRGISTLTNPKMNYCF